MAAIKLGKGAATLALRDRLQLLAQIVSVDDGAGSSSLTIDANGELTATWPTGTWTPAPGAIGGSDASAYTSSGRYVDFGNAVHVV
jgi:hypothetical protein